MVYLPVVIFAHQFATSPELTETHMSRIIRVWTFCNRDCVGAASGRATLTVGPLPKVGHLQQPGGLSARQAQLPRQLPPALSLHLLPHLQHARRIGPTAANERRHLHTQSTHHGTPNQREACQPPPTLGATQCLHYFSVPHARRRTKWLPVAQSGDARLWSGRQLRNSATIDAAAVS